jgi:hypothetical protein
MRGFPSLHLPTLVAAAFAAGLAGCASNAATPPPVVSASSAGVPPPVPLRLAGTLRLPPSGGSGAERTEIPFRVNASGEAVGVAVRLGSRRAAELPLATAEATAELHDPANVTLANSTLRAGSADASLQATANATGTHKLEILSYGGSDGKTAGDFVTYDIDVEGSG